MAKSQNDSSRLATTWKYCSTKWKGKANYMMSGDSPICGDYEYSGHTDATEIAYDL